MTDQFVDLDGQSKQRATGADQRNLRERIEAAIWSLPGFESDEDLLMWMGFAQEMYEAGFYARARSGLLWSLGRLPSLEPYLEYYVKVCERVLATPMDADDL